MKDALEFIGKIEAFGGTNIEEALTDALRMSPDSVSSAQPSRGARARYTIRPYSRCASGLGWRHGGGLSQLGPVISGGVTTYGERSRASVTNR